MHYLPIPQTPRLLFACLVATSVFLACRRQEQNVQTMVHSRSKVSSTKKEPFTAQASIPLNDLLPKSPQAKTALSPILERENVRADNWDTEAFSDQAVAQLKKLAEWMSAGKLTKYHIAQLFAPEFESDSFRPTVVHTVFQDDFVSIARQATNGKETRTNAIDDVVGALFPSDATVHVHTKLYRVTRIDSSTETTVFYKALAQRDEERLQQNAVWHITWDDAAPPRITDIDVRDFEEVSVRSKSDGSFQDATWPVLGHNESFRKQLSLGVDHWRKRLEANYGVDPNGNQGLAIGDVNGDGLEDLFVCQQGGLPNRLYLRAPNGQLKDISADAGVDWMEMCRAALFVDFDNDGDQDLAMAQGWYLMLMSNDGQGKFQRVLQMRWDANLHSLTAADYDQDGDVDLFCCGRNPAREQGGSEGILGTPIPYHDANNGGPNLLLRNEGGLRFTDVTKQVGLDQNNRRYSYAASWADYDNDGDMDLYVANDFGRNNLYRNDQIEGRRQFSDVADALGVEDISAGMSVTWGDFNNDSVMDAYVSNMFSSAGNRIAYQRQFREHTDSQQRKHFQRHARGNTLFEGFREDGGISFRDVSESAQVTMGRWAWGAKFCDFNNDGWEDLYVANGFISTADTGDL